MIHFNISVFLLCILFHFSFALNFKLSKVNAKLKYAHEARIYREARLTFLCSELVEIAENLVNKSSNDNLEFFGVNSTTTNDFLILLNEAKLINDSFGSLGNFKPYTNISSCFALKCKIEMMDFELKKLKNIREILNLKRSVLFFMDPIKVLDLPKIDEYYAKVSQILKEVSKYFEALESDIRLLKGFNETLVKFYESSCNENGEKNISALSYESMIDQLVAIKDGKLFLKFKNLMNDTQQRNVSFMNLTDFYGNVSEVFSNDFWKDENRTICDCSSLFYRFKFLSIKELSYISLLDKIYFHHQWMVFKELTHTELIKLIKNYYSFFLDSKRKIARAARIFYHFSRAICDFPMRNEKEKQNTPCGKMKLIDGSNLENEGFYSGTYIDGSKIYPGKADFAIFFKNLSQGQMNDTEFFLPAMIRSYENENKSYCINHTAIGFSPLGRTTLLTNQSKHIILSHEMLRWKKTNVQNVDSELDLVEIVLKITGSEYKINFVRSLFTSGNKSYHVIGSRIFSMNYRPISIGIYPAPSEFDVLTCGGSELCGDLMTNGISINGLLSGVFIDGSLVYPRVLKLGSKLLPARISNQTSFSCFKDSNKEIVENDRSSFFYAHSKLKWAATTLNEASKIPGAITLQENENITRLIARFNFTHRNQTFQQIGTFESETSSAFYWNGEKIEENQGIFEVLTCTQCENGGSGVFCCLNGANNADCCLLENCDLGKKENKGLKSGKFIDGSLLYPGIVYIENSGWRPARIANGTAYSPDFEQEKEIAENTTSNFHLAHANYTWIQSNKWTADDIPDVIKLKSKNETKLLIARFNFTLKGKTYQQIGIFETRTLKAYFWNGQNVDKKKISFDVLTCAGCQIDTTEYPVACVYSPSSCIYKQKLCGIPVTSKKSSDITQKGLESGKHWTNNSLYPGVVSYTFKDSTKIFHFIGLLINDSISYYGELSFDDPSFESPVVSKQLMIFERNPNLKWIRTDKEKIFNVTGAIDVYHGIYGITYLAKINVTQNKQTYQTFGLFVEKELKLFHWRNKTKTTHEEIFDVLACN